MKSAKRERRLRQRWVELYAETRDAGLVCRRCGISRPTLRKWWRRFKALGEEGLAELSRRPHNSPTRKVTAITEQWILDLRRQRRLGPKRIQGELMRLHECRLSSATIWKVLHRHEATPLPRRRRHPEPRRYNRELPGEGVQMDTFKVGPRLYQYTALDDCTRLRVLAIYPRRTAKNSVHFLLNRVLEEFPFPIQRVQTDRGAEFFGLAFQETLRDCAIKFRPIPPGSPHLNGKVERSQQTDWVEFYGTADLADSDLTDRLEEWQFFYNWYRPHSGLNGQTPMERCCDLLPQTPLSAEVWARYDPARERLRERDFKVDRLLASLKRSL